MRSWHPRRAHVGVKISFCTRVNVAVGSIGSPLPRSGSVGSFNFPHAKKRSGTTNASLRIARESLAKRVTTSELEISSRLAEGSLQCAVQRQFNGTIRLR